MTVIEETVRRRAISALEDLGASATPEQKIRSVCQSIIYCGSGLESKSVDLKQFGYLVSELLGCGRNYAEYT